MTHVKGLNQIAEMTQNTEQVLPWFYQNCKVKQAFLKKFQKNLKLIFLRDKNVNKFKMTHVGRACFMETNSKMTQPWKKFFCKEYKSHLKINELVD
jgi:hypothetical protein